MPLPRKFHETIIFCRTKKPDITVLYLGKSSAFATDIIWTAKREFDWSETCSQARKKPFYYTIGGATKKGSK